MHTGSKNSKVFEQKGDLLNFKANIDPRAVLSQVKPGWADKLSKLSLNKLSQAEPSWAELSRAEPSWAKLSQAEPSWEKLCKAEPSWSVVKMHGRLISLED